MAVEAYLSGGWPLSSWISPGAAFFLFVNVLIGAIVVTSRGHHQGGGRAGAAASTRRLCRSASSMVLDRLRSFSIFSVHPAVPVEMEAEYYSTSRPELELEAEELEQLHHQPAAVADPAGSPVAPAAPADGGASSEIAKEEAEEAGEHVSTSSDDEAAHGLPLQSLGRQQSPPSVVDVATDDEATAAAVESQSQEDKLAEATMQQRAPACRREAEDEALEGKAALNARAESFIRRFREDLKLERLNSIINYTRTLRRGGAGAASPTAQ